MKELPRDYARCANDSCDLRHNCLRHVPRPRKVADVEGYSFTDWRGGTDCCGYIDREEEDEV